MTTYREFHRRSIEDKEGFWAEQAKLVHWERPPEKVLDYGRPPFARWFVGGETNLCYNAIDRHLAARGDQRALAYISTETGEERSFSYRELHLEVQRAAAMMRSLGIGKGDRVIVYMPMIPEAAFVILACARIGAIHSVVFGGFAAASLAARIDDARPKLMVTADGGSRMGKVVTYKALVDESIRLAKHPPRKVVIFRRGLDPSMQAVAGRDLDYGELRAEHMDAKVPVVWLESNEPSYILYTSGTTGKPKGVQRDVGGYAVALAASMKHIYCGGAGDTMFTTSDIGWVVGHSYIIYGPLIAGMTTVMYEGVPVRPDAGIWWKIVQDHKVNVMFSAPTAIRVLKKHDPALLRKYDLGSLRHLFLAGEPLDEPTHAWIAEALQKPVIDHYWQTETGWPILSSVPGVEKTPIKLGSPSFPAYGYDLRLEAPARSRCRRGRDRRESGGRHRAAPAAGLHDDGVGRRRALRRDLLRDLQQEDGLFDFRLGDARQGRLLLHSRPYRRCDQRRRPPPGHARDRGSGQHALEHRRMRRGGRGRFPEGPDAACVCRGEGSVQAEFCRGPQGI